MAVRRERGLLDPDAAPGESIFDHQIYCLASDGDIEEGISSEASSLAGTQRLGNLTLIYDSNRISIEDDTNIALTEDTAARYAAYGWHVQTVDWTNGDTQYEENVAALHDAHRGGQSGDRPAQLHRACGRSSAGRPPSCRAPARRTARRSATTRSPRPRRCWASIRTRPSRSPTRSSRTPASCSSAGQQAQDEWQQAFDSWAEANPEGKALYDRFVDERAQPRLGGRPAELGCRSQGHRDPRRLRQGAQRDRPQDARAVGRLGRPGRVQQHHPGGRAELPARRSADEGLPGRPVRPGAALRHPRARHGRDPERHQGARRDPAVRRHLPDVQRLHARRGPARRR